MCVFETSAFRNGYYNRSIFIHRSRLRSVLLSFFLFFFLPLLSPSIDPPFVFSHITRVYLYHPFGLETSNLVDGDGSINYMLKLLRAGLIIDIHRI